MSKSINIDNVKSVEFVPFQQTLRFKTTKSYPCFRATKKFPFIKFLRKKDCRPDEISLCIWDDWCNYTTEQLKGMNYSIIDEKIYLNPHVLINYIDDTTQRIFFETEEEAKQKCKELLKRFGKKMVQIK